MRELRTLCERLLQGLDQDPQALAVRLGTVDDSGSDDGSIKVVSSGPGFSAAEIWASFDAGTTTMVDLVPGQPVTLADVSAALGPHAESPRRHPPDPRKVVFSPRTAGSHPFFVVVVAYVAGDEPVQESAAVQKVTITCSPTGPVWRPLLEGRVDFGVASWREGSLSDVRSELERVLGVELRPSHEKVYDGEPAFECALPGCELRLNSWPAVEPRLTYFNFIALRGYGQARGQPRAEDIGDALAEYLRNAGCDWYVPDVTESYESGGVLGDRILEPDVVVSMLAPRWLAWTDAEEKDAGRALLRQIAERWVTAARRTADPRAYVVRRRAELEGLSLNVPPRSRLSVLGTYAIQPPWKYGARRR
jgi:hypothetical protein